MSKTLKALIVEDSEDDAILIIRALSRAGYEVASRRVDTVEAMREALVAESWDIVLSDYSMPSFSGSDALRTLQATELDLPFIVVSGAIGEERAVELMRAGVHDYVMKDKLARLAPAVERELREAEGRRARRVAEEQIYMLYRSLEQSANLLMITDTEGIVEYINPAFSRVTDYSPYEIVGMPLNTIRSEETPDELYEQLWTTVRAGNTWRGEMLHKKKNGETYWAEMTMTGIRNAQGEITQFLLAQEDISERKRLEGELRRYMEQLELMVEARTNELQRAKNQIEAILSNISDAIALAQPSGDIQTANPAFARLFGENVTSYLESIFWVLPDPQQMETVARALVTAIHDHEHQRVEARVTSVDGQKLDVDLSFVPISTQESPDAAILLSVHDITQFKELERLKSRFVADAVHDLATPISGLRTRLYLLKHNPERLGQHIQSLENQVEHLSDLLSELRTLSQLDRGQMSLNRELVRVNDVVRRVFDTYEPVAISKHQALIFRPLSQLPEVRLDRRQFERVIVNLVSNAINYTAENKSIQIRTLLRDDHIMIEVADEGIGIAPEDLKRIFDRFFRSDQARLTQPNGTGLGLAIVKEIIELHGGKVSVTSELGRGSTFCIKLPPG